MRVLVTGAGGFLGEAAVRACARAGHEVRGLVRLPAQSARVRDAGGIAVVGSVLEPTTLGAAVDGCDAVVHLAQARGAAPELARAVRVDGAGNLLAAIRRSGARRFIIGSGYWVYRDNPGLLTEDSPLEPLGISAINFETERVVRAAEQRGEVDAIVVRPGMVYGDGSWFREMVEELRAGTYRYVGEGTNRLSPVALDDTGEAFRRILDGGRPRTTYLVVDDAPVPTRDFARFVARELQVPEPSGLPRAEAEHLWGADLARLNAADRGASNARLRSLGWVPCYPTYRDGVPRVVRAMQGDPK